MAKHGMRTGVRIAVRANPTRELRSAPNPPLKRNPKAGPMPGYGRVNIAADDNGAISTKTPWKSAK